MSPTLSFKEAGWREPFPVETHILPLLETPKDVQNALHAPLNLLPDHYLAIPEVAFKIGEEEWLTTRHVFPAAYPRSHSQSVRLIGQKSFLPPLDPSTLYSTSEMLKEDRKKNMQLGIEMIRSVNLKELIPAKDENEAKQRAIRLSQQGQPQLWNCVERISSKRIDPKGKPITLIMLPATGFSKETMRPIDKGIIENFEKAQSDFYIDEIWNYDMFFSGDSALMNIPFLGPAICVHDYARDFQQFMQFYLPKRDKINKGMQPYPAHLERQSNNLTIKTRTTIAIGHSLGAITLNAAVHNIARRGKPETQLVDGYIGYDGTQFLQEQIMDVPFPSSEPLALSNFVRKEIFKDKKDLVQYFSKVPLYKNFDPEITNLYVNYSFKQLRSNESNQISALTMKTPKWVEALYYSQSWMVAYQSPGMKANQFQGWTYLLNSNAISKSFFKFTREAGQVYKQLAAKHSTKMTYEEMDAEHLYPLEKPKEFGDRVAKILQSQLKPDRGDLTFLKRKVVLRRTKL